ncbi:MULTISPECIES: MarR family winged helix-turn-helix transcriptional regulator [Mycolicibacterium]|jgi:DNA-binding MarR family transcriptional regulator|uniref:Transcriptional regulator n=3 Tax=Mycolicibacterium TaxID=1866885 RepID=A0A378SVV4_9MYCO|nr:MULTISPECIES: MarR family transcriptional regulator [Mycolicibacterium]KLI06770.1 MarR family transcriptional regulator [Mycolicibacterium senegalense]KLO53636.1 MarR family transcriptional regulator [Mycolicibacterium senegalense]KMV19921.1 MarR family transcriptional regulator [Mycolicibacterium conceptionense]MCV7334229.1 MarR family transcriptional regulator [Mycolicibacterium senegalense]MCW1821811.1 MarR family transcriptional regulator [Mycolicibacterium senegalense]
MPGDPQNRLADEVWGALTTLVFDHRDRWRRAVIERTGLPFSRIRVLKRLAREPLTVKQLAYAATVDAPAATVAVNDLEERGLVVREIDPANRRSKLVSLTDDGRALLARLNDVEDPAPQALAALDTADLEALRGILRKITAP